MNILHPFFIFPGILPVPIIGQDFIQSLRVVLDPNVYALLKAYHKKIQELNKRNHSRKIKLETETNFYDRTLKGTISALSIEVYYIEPYEITIVGMMFALYPLMPNTCYRIRIISKGNNKINFDLKNNIFVTGAKDTPTEVLLIITSAMSCEIAEGEDIVWFLPIPHKRVDAAKMVCSVSLTENQ